MLSIVLQVTCLSDLSPPATSNVGDRSCSSYIDHALVLDVIDVVLNNQPTVAVLVMKLGETGVFPGDPYFAAQESRTKLVPHTCICSQCSPPTTDSVTAWLSNSGWKGGERERVHMGVVALHPCTEQRLGLSILFIGDSTITL